MMALHSAAENRHTELVQLLLEHKADIDAKTSCGETALLWAALEGQVEVVQQLLETGADVEIKNK
jgi:ankyrin repeat protein